MPDTDSSVTNPFERAFSMIATSTQEALSRMRNDLAVIRSEMEAVKEENRSLRADLATRAVAPVVQPPEPVDVEAIATRAAALIPAPKDGEPGKDGIDGKDGAPGERGADGINGRDGNDGLNGRDGRDGIATREELESLVQTEVTRAVGDLTVRTVADTYRDVWAPGLFTRGDFSTWDGSLWLALQDTDKQPGTLNSGWKLVTKRGRDGRDKR